MKRSSYVTVGTLCLLFCCSSIAAGQQYRFRVPKAEMSVFVQPDASVRVVYDITFKNEFGAHPIDVVDIGTFHKGYDLGNVRPSSEGFSLTNIKPSTEIATGFEVHTDLSLADIERAYILHILEQTEGNQRRAAEILGINPSTLWRKMKRYHRDS